MSVRDEDESGVLECEMEGASEQSTNEKTYHRRDIFRVAFA